MGYNMGIQNYEPTGMRNSQQQWQHFQTNLQKTVHGQQSDLQLCFPWLDTLWIPGSQAKYSECSYQIVKMRLTYSSTSSLPMCLLRGRIPFTNVMKFQVNGSFDPIPLVNLDLNIHSKLNKTHPPWDSERFCSTTT